MFVAVGGQKLRTSPEGFWDNHLIIFELSRVGGEARMRQFVAKFEYAPDR
jgi:hypothetical protein